MKKGLSAVINAVASLFPRMAKRVRGVPAIAVPANARFVGTWLSDDEGGFRLLLRADADGNCEQFFTELDGGDALLIDAEFGESRQAGRYWIAGNEIRFMWNSSSEDQVLYDFIDDNHMKTYWQYLDRETAVTHVTRVK
jgi:hypothetical protein